MAVAKLQKVNDKFISPEIRGSEPYICQGKPKDGLCPPIRFVLVGKLPLKKVLVGDYLSWNNRKMPRCRSSARSTPHGRPGVFEHRRVHTVGGGGVGVR